MRRLSLQPTLTLVTTEDSEIESGTSIHSGSPSEGGSEVSSGEESNDGVVRDLEYYRSDRFPDASSYHKSVVFLENCRRFAMGLGDERNMWCDNEYPCAWYTAYRRVPTFEELDFSPRWPWSYLVIVRGSRIGVFPDFLQFCIWIDIPGSIWWHTEDMESAQRFCEQHFQGEEPDPQILPFNEEYTMKSPIDESNIKYQRDVAMSVSSHRGPLLYGFEGESLVRLSPEAPEPATAESDVVYGDAYDD